MKKIISSILIVSSLFAVSCSKDMVIKESSNDVTLGATLEQQIQSKTALGTGNTVVWSANDKLSVLSSANSVGGDEFTLKTGAGEVAGTFKGTLSTAESYYALYPYCATAETSGSYIKTKISRQQAYVAGSFAKDANVSLAPFSVSTADDLSFKNIMGVLELQLKGTCAVDSIIVSDRKGNYLSGKMSVIKTDFSTSFELGSASVSLICNPSITLKADEATNFYIVLPVGSLDGGFDIDIASPDGHRYLRSSSSNTIKRSTIRVMPEKTLPVNPDSTIDLSAEGTSNCYIVGQSGSYRFFVGSKGNAGKTATGTDLLKVDHVALLWSTDNTANEQTQAIIKNITLDDMYVTFSYDGSTKGNAVIAAYDNKSTIIWSWHIWCTEVPQDKGPFVNGEMLMDRDLGAISAIPGDLGCAGLRYQAGRKDPFVGSSNYRINNKSKSVPMSVFGIVRTTEQKAATIDDTVQNPTTHYLNSSGSGLSINNWGYTTKTIYDPCPVGYRIPVNNPWEKATEGTIIITTTGTWDYGWSYSYDGNDLGFVPASGFWYDTKDGEDYVGNTCYSRFCKDFDGGAGFLMVSETDPFSVVNGPASAYALSSRCAKIK